MIWAVLTLLAAVSLLGHAMFWISFWNRTQGVATPLWLVNLLSRMAKLCFVFIPPTIMLGLLILKGQSSTALMMKGYVGLTFLYGLVSVPIAYRRRRRPELKTKIRQTASTVLNFEDSRRESLAGVGIRSRRLLFNISENQSFEFENNEKHIEIPRLERELDGLTIAHLTDLHFTGKIAKSYFDHAIDLINEMDADIIAVTGDLIDGKEFMSWIPDTLGRLRARHGVYFVLGNHDCRYNLSNLRMVLSESGLTHLGGCVKQLTIRGKNIVLAGNELPWILPAPDMSDCPSRDELSHLRVLLAHTPDQIDWAKRFDFDLMLAGHTHGGQFRIPGFGPFVCPIRKPLDYASGTIWEEPTVLHVSRGLSGKVPLRLNCRPEITKLVLCCPQRPSSTDNDGESILVEVNEMLEATKQVYEPQETEKLLT